MNLSKLFIAALLVTNVYADDMGDNLRELLGTENKNITTTGDTALRSYKYKLGSIVLINLNGSRWNGECDGVGRIWKIEKNRYYVKGVFCKTGYDDLFNVPERDVLDVFTEKDFEDDGRYEDGGWFSRDKSEDWLPCKKNDYSEDVKEELCEKNKFRYY